MGVRHCGVASYGLGNQPDSGYHSPFGWLSPTRLTDLELVQIEATETGNPATEAIAPRLGNTFGGVAQLVRASGS